MKLKIRTYRATDEPETCTKFVHEHRKVLKDYGISNITTNTEEWVNNKNVYCLVAESETEKKIVGGLRLQISEEDIQLPLEMAIGRLDKKIYGIVGQFRNSGGVAELCALWNAKSVAGKGLGVIMVRAGIAASDQLRINTLMCICADYTLKMFQEVGFVVDNSLGWHGEFPYPNENYKAKVLGIMNAHDYSTAQNYDKLRMTSLRDNRTQQFIENGIGNPIEVDYNLNFAPEK